MSESLYDIDFICLELCMKNDVVSHWLNFESQYAFAW